MLPLEWIGLLLGLAVSLDIVCAKFRGWHSRRSAIKRGRTLTAKYALEPQRESKDMRRSRRAFTEAPVAIGDAPGGFASRRSAP